MAALVFWRPIQASAENLPLEKTEAKPSTKKTSPSGTMSKEEKPPCRKATLPGTFAIINTVSPDSSTRKNLHLLYEILDKTSLGKGLDKEDLRNALLSAPFDGSFEKADNKLTKGRALYGELKFEEAIDVLKRAKSIFLEHVGQEKGSEGLASTLSYLILSMNSIGQEEQMREYAEILHYVVAGAYPQTIPSSLWKKILPKKRPQKRPLKIRAPKEASVYVNFKLLEDDAQTVDDNNALWTLISHTGLLHVVVEAPGHKKFYTKIQPGRDEVYIVAGMSPLAEDPHQDVRNTVGEWLSKPTVPGEKDMLSLAEKTGADRLILARRKKETIILQIFEAKKKKLLPLSFEVIPSVSVEHSENLSLWATAVAKSLAPKPIDLKKSKRKAAVKVTEKKTLPPKKKKPVPVWKRWYFWTALGVVGIVTVVFAVRKDPESRVEIKVQRP